MCKALMEIMEPQVLRRENEARQEGLRTGIRGNVDILREFGHDDMEIKVAIIRRYGLSDEEAEKYL